MAKSILTVIKEPQKFGGNYLVNIDDKNKVLYFETPKVACTSIKKFMQDNYVKHDIGLDSISDVHDRDRSPLRKFSDFNKIERLEMVFSEQFRRFTFVRNPYTRILSGYLDKIVTNDWERQRHYPTLGFELSKIPSFHEFLHRIGEIKDAERDIHFRSQSQLIYINQVEYDFIGAFEAFKHDFSVCKEQIFNNRSEDDYRSFGMHHSTNASNKLHDYFGLKEIELVNEIYRNDFINFGYSFGIDNAFCHPNKSLINFNGCTPLFDFLSNEHCDLLYQLISSSLLDESTVCNIVRRLVYSSLDFNEKEKIINLSSRVYGNNSVIAAQLGHLFYYHRQYDKSIDFWNEFISSYGSKPIAYISLAKIYKDVGESDMFVEAISNIDVDSSPDWVVIELEKLKDRGII